VHRIEEADRRDEVVRGDADDDNLGNVGVHAVEQRQRLWDERPAWTLGLAAATATSPAPHHSCTSADSSLGRARWGERRRRPRRRVAVGAGLCVALEQRQHATLMHCCISIVHGLRPPLQLGLGERRHIQVTFRVRVVRVTLTQRLG
jgi:hypothetical protein